MGASKSCYSSARPGSKGSGKREARGEKVPHLRELSEKAQKSPWGKERGKSTEVGGGEGLEGVLEAWLEQEAQLRTECGFACPG